MARVLTRAALATTALMLGSMAAPVVAQVITNSPGPMNTVPAIRQSGAFPRLGIPSTHSSGFGVRSEAPRGIGKINGPLTPPPLPPLAPRTGVPTTIPDNSNFGDFRNLPGGGSIVRGSDGRWFPAPWSVPGTVSGDHVSIGSSGFDAAVTAHGDKWWFAAALNNSLGHRWLSGHDQWRNCVINPGFFYGYPLGWSYYNDYSYPSTFGVDPYYSTDSFVARGAEPPPAQPAVDPDAGLTIPEKGAKRLREGRPDEAIALLRTYADANPSEVHAARTLAIALIDARRTKEGVAVMALVYQREPLLAREPIDADAVGPTRELRDLVVRVVEFGHRTNSASAWLTAGVLMQGEGRNEPALRMVERADKLGLDAEVSKQLHGVLAQ